MTQQAISTNTGFSSSLQPQQHHDKKQSKLSASNTLSKIKIIEILPDSPDADSAIMRCKELFTNSFRDAYQTLTALDLKLQPGTTKQDFLDGAFEDELTDFTRAKETDSKTRFYEVQACQVAQTPKTIGYASMDQMDDDANPTIYLRQMAINPNCQRQGVGKQLFFRVIRDANPAMGTLTFNTRKVNDPMLAIAQHQADRAGCN